MEKISNFIGGEWIAPISGKYLENFSPATGEVCSLIPDSDERDVEKAVLAAEKAFPEWSQKTAEERARILRKISAAIEQRLDEFAKTETIDTGKPISLSKKLDIPRSARNFEFFSDAITQFSSEFHKSSNYFNYTLREPLGVVGCISPWNLPLYLLSWKIAPALAAGNTVVAKPSEITPMTAHLLSKACAESGLPPGVLNIVHGLGGKVGSAISKNPAIRAISFTGSTRTGREIARTASESFKKLSLEMGGKNASVIFEDCDFNEAIETTLRSAFSNQGQICLCTSRIFVQKSIYEKFKDALIRKIKELKQGDPLKPETEQGAVASKMHFEKIMSCIELAKKEGGKILTGGHAFTATGAGWFVEPTLIEGLKENCHTNQEEIFGPVATIAPFEGEDEVIEWANSTRYGLAAVVWTNDLSRAHRVASKIHSGIVWVNCWMVRDLRTPFGGVKESGMGREGGFEILDFFTEPKNVCIQVKS